MNVFYEEDGGFKVGTVMTDNDTSLQVEAPHGKRSKIKASAVLLRFAQPAAAGFMEAAEAASDELDLEFLWECSGTEEFSFTDLAQDYYGRPATPVEAAGLLLKLHNSPMHFYKKGKGRYKPATAEALQSALASAERKRLQALQLDAYVEQLTSHTLPSEFRSLVQALLFKPDKQTIEYKALEQACAATGLSPARLMEKCGALDSPEDYHLGAFLLEYFPKGTGFGPCAEFDRPLELPESDVAAFSIDDAATTEIDDAFSVTLLPNGNRRIGVHIAAPALGLLPGSELDAVAAQRLSTVYMPGRKITMLPDPVVEFFTLQAGASRPALSMYLEVAPDGTIIGMDSRAEFVRVAANLRHDTLEPLFNEETVASCEGDYPFKDELLFLWQFADKLEEQRGRPDQNKTFAPDYNFHIEDGRVTITERRRGTPIDKVVAELMILVNSRWARLLADSQVTAIYRGQENGKVRMTTAPTAHQGLGVDLYMWSSSPLRRYIDLVNQRQLVAALSGQPAPYQPRDAGVYAVMRSFEVAYDAYNDIQRTMERYWSLRYLMQEGWTEATGTVLRDNLVRLDRLPLFARVSNLPPGVASGAAIRLELGEVDLLDLSFACRFTELCGAAVAEV